MGNRTFLEAVGFSDETGDIPLPYLTERPEWSQTIRREWVHRESIADVFLTSLSAGTAPDTFVLGGQWPRTHSFYRPDDHRRQDVFLLPETLRQAGIAIAHCAYHNPLGWQFLMGDMHFVIVDDALLAVGTTPTNLELQTTLSNMRLRDGVLRSAMVSMVALKDDQVLGKAWATMRCLPRAIYLRMQPPADRREDGAELAALPGLHPTLVGRHDRIDVLLATDESPGGTGRSWLLRIDPTHPALFDHPLDHVPGMAQLEVARQAAVALTESGSCPPLVIGCRARFDSPVRLDRRACCHAVLTPDAGTPLPLPDPAIGRTVIVTIRGGDRTMSHIALTLRLPEANANHERFLAT